MNEWMNEYHIFNQTDKYGLFLAPSPIFTTLFLGAVCVYSWRHPRGMPVWWDSHPSQRVCSHLQRLTEGWHPEQHLSAQRRVPGEIFLWSLVISFSQWKCHRKWKRLSNLYSVDNFTVKDFALCLFIYWCMFVRCLELCQVIIGALKDNSDSNLFVFYTATKVIDVSFFLTFKDLTAF